MTSVAKCDELYSGKAKSVFETDQTDFLILHFRDDTSAFDGEKRQALARKGEVNNKFNAHIMEYLATRGVPTHFETLLNDRESLVKRLSMFPVECVVRNISAGSICKRLGVPEGKDLSPPTFEFFLKNDALHDPMINESHIETFGWANAAQVAAMKKLTLQANAALTELFAKAGILLVDYKLEFGDFHGEVVLGDEFTPDGCRLWDAETRKKLDKDRFRQGLGDVVEAYEEVARRLNVNLAPIAA